MLCSANAWQCPSRGGLDWVVNPHRSTLFGRLRPPGFTYGDFIYTLSAKATRGSLGTKNGGSFVQVQDLWAIANKDYDKLRDRYRRDRRQHARARNLHWLTAPMFDPLWVPRTGPALSTEESKFLQMRPEVEFYRHVCTGPSGKVRFQPYRGGVHDDSIIKTWYLEDGQQHVAYGQILKIFTHSMFPGGPKDVVVECEWFDPVPDNDEACLPQVRRNSNSAFNQSARFTFLRQCAAYNIMIAPHDPWEAKCDIYDVIDRWRTYEDHTQQD